MGLSSFASRENAIDYATDPSQEGAAVKISGHRPLILELEAGARVATLGTGSERVKRHQCPDHHHRQRPDLQAPEPAQCHL